MINPTIQLFDTHCHLHYIPENEIPGLINNARAAGVEKMLSVSTHLWDCYKQESILKLDNCIYQSLGVHPLHSHEYTLDDIHKYLNYDAPRVIAIGETGLDDFRQPLNPEQIDSFKIHIEIAKIRNLPLILHTRSNTELVERECMKLLTGSNVTVIGHCFGGSLEFAQFILNENPKSVISFAGNLTYPKATNLHQLAAELPLDRIVIETDAPYLSPTPHRGKQNQPAYVVNTLSKLAEIKGLGIRETAEIVFRNSMNLFGNLISS